MGDKIWFENIKVGDDLPMLVKAPVTKDQLIRYAGASGDFNPLHTDPEVGKSLGIGGQIAHGMLIMGFGGQAITNWLPLRYLKKYTVRFIGMTRLGDVITVMGKVTDKKQESGQNIIACELSAKNQKNEAIFSGMFEAFLPVE